MFALQENILTEKDKPEVVLMVNMCLYKSETCIWIKYRLVFASKVYIKDRPEVKYMVNMCLYKSENASE